MSNPANLPINPATATEEELESFRRQWREEVSARSRHQSFLAAAQRPAPASSSKPHPSHRNKAPVIPETPRDAHDGHDDAEQHAYHDLDEKHSGRKLADPAPAPTGVPVSALEHYEEAVRRETQGKLGDSVNLYRKAFKVRCTLSAHFDVFSDPHCSLMQLCRISTRRNISQPLHSLPRSLQTPTHRMRRPQSLILPITH